MGIYQLVATSLAVVALMGCGGGLYDDDKNSLIRVETKASYGGDLSPTTLQLKSGATGQFSLAVRTGYRIDSVTGCDGTLSGHIFTTGQVREQCIVVAEFVYDLPASHMVSATTIYDHGTIQPALVSVQAGSVAQFTVSHLAGYAPVFSGCEGNYVAPYFTTAPIETSCDIDVSFKGVLPNTHVIEVKQNEGGRVIPQALSVEHGTQAQFLIEPNPGFKARFSGCDGELVGSFFVTGEAFNPCRLNVDFYPQLLDGLLVKATSDADGSVFPEVAYVPSGSSAQFVITPPRGRAPGAITGCPGRLDGNVFTTAALSAPCDLHVTYKLDTPEAFIVEARTNAGGAITPSYASVAKGSVGQFFVAPNNGKAIGNVDAVGCRVEIVGNTINTEPLDADCSISVDFIDAVTIAASFSAGGTISPQSLTVAPEQSASFSVQANEGWQIERVYGCNGVLSGSTYTVRAGRTSCEVYASFKSIDLFTASAVVMGSGAIVPQVATRKAGETVNFRVSPNPGWELSQINGCDGRVSNNNYAVTIDKDCEFIALFHEKLPPQNLRLTTGPENASIIHTFDAVPGAVSYNVYFSRSLDVSPYRNEGAWRNAPRNGYHYALHGNTTYYYVVTAVFGSGAATYEGQPSSVASGRSSF